MFKNKLTYKSLVLFTALVFASVEVFPAVMVCVMGSSCTMMAKTSKCHQSKKDDGVSVSTTMSCCSEITAEKKSAEKEIFPQSQMTGLFISFPVELSYKTKFQFISSTLLNPDISPPPLFLLKQSFLI